MENDVKPQIRTIAEQHGTIIEKLDDLKELNEKAINLQGDTQVHKAAVKDLYNKVAK